MLPEVPDFNPDIPDFNPEAWHGLIDSLDQLIQYASIPEERKEMLYKQIFNMSIEEGVKLYIELKDKQIDRITGGLNYNMTEIINHLQKYLWQP